MYFCCVTAKSILASYRIPETQSYHQTLPLPPVTTLTGMLGAALGYDYAAVFQFVVQNKIMVGVSGTSNGDTKDLWNYRKITTKEKRFSAEDIQNRKNYSIVLKEYLFDNVLRLYYAHSDEATVDKIRNAFLNPVFPLTAGSSDDLIKIVSVTKYEAAPTKADTFRYTVLTGDLAGRYTVSEDVFRKPIYASIKSPKTYFLPVNFSFDSSVRKVTARETFTFVGDEIKLKTPIECYHINGENIETYSF